MEKAKMMMMTSCLQNVLKLKKYRHDHYQDGIFV
jgi:hypothetical protein